MTQFIFDWNVLFNDPWSLAAYICMLVGLVSLFLSRSLTLVFLLLSLGTAFVSHRIGGTGLSISAGIFVACAWLKQTQRFPVQLALTLFLIGILTAFKLHLFTDFHNWLITDKQVINKGAIPYTLFINFDMPILALCLGYFCCQNLTSKTNYWQLTKQTLPVIASGALIVCGLALAAGFTKVDPTWNNFTYFWFVHNLILVCISEEIIFRGWMLQSLSKKLTNMKYGKFLANFLVSLLFAYYHLYGGIIYAALAGIMSLHYGYAIQRTGRVQAAIMVHFFVNLIHFVGFTYPALATSA